MSEVPKNKLIVLFMIAVILIVLIAGQSHGQLRKIKVGDKMPEFTLPDTNNLDFTYKHNGNKVLAIVFLSSQKQSVLAAAGFATVLKNFPDNCPPFDAIAVINDPNHQTHLSLLQKENFSNFHIVLDSEYKLWGKLGLIAIPTVIVVGKDNRVLWAKAGYGYDFAPALKRNLGKALGLFQGEDPETSTEVKTLSNSTVTARVYRHLQMAKMLEQKGQFESAIEESRKAYDLDPNSINTRLSLGRLYCRTAQSQEAIKIVTELKPRNRVQKAEYNLILGWANRQLNQLDIAQEFLSKSTKLNPESARSLFELGKVYQIKGETQKAMQVYYKALALIFDESAGKAIQK